MKPRVAVAGPGKVGCALGKRLVDAGYPLTRLYARDAQKGREATDFIGIPAACVTSEPVELTNAELIFLCLPDDRLENFSVRLAKEAALSPATTLVHCSGLHPASILAPGKEIGRLSLHPLLPFSDRETAVEQLSGCPFAVEGDEKRIKLGEELVRALGGHPFHIPSSTKASYHAAACVASNYLVSLTDFACSLLTQCGLKEDEALDLLAPLQRATLDNLQRFGPQQALTGPIVRGDVGTLERHQEIITDVNQLTLYRKLAVATLQLATSSGRLSPEKAAAIRSSLDME